MSRITLLMTMLIVLTLTACKQAAPDGGDPLTRPLIIEPEQLISKEEAEELLGEAVKDGEKSEQLAVGQKICFYGLPEDSNYFIQISVTQAAVMSNTDQTVEDIYMSLKEGLIETAEQKQVDGVGDEYFFGTPGLHILKNGYYLCIAAGNTNDDRVLDYLAQAGALAVKNLENILRGVKTNENY